MLNGYALGLSLVVVQAIPIPEKTIIKTVLRNIQHLPMFVLSYFVLSYDVNLLVLNLD